MSVTTLFFNDQKIVKFSKQSHLICVQRSALHNYHYFVNLSRQSDNFDPQWMNHSFFRRSLRFSFGEWMKTDRKVVWLPDELSFWVCAMAWKSESERAWVWAWEWEWEWDKSFAGFAGEVITKYGQPAKLAKNRVEGCPCAYNFGIESSVRLVLPILVPIIAGGA